MALLLAVLLLAGLVLVVLWRRPAPNSSDPVARSWRLWLCFVLGGLCIGALVSMLDGRPVDNAVRYAVRVFIPRGAVDSWGPMVNAIHLLQANPGQSLYQTLFFEQHMKFQYPLTSLVPLDLAQRLFGLADGTLLVALQVVSRLCVPLIGLVFAMLIANAARASEPYARDASAPGVGWRGVLIGILSTVLFYPIALSETLGQVQTIMTLLAAVALLAWQRGAKVLAGICIGLCCIVKPHWLVIAPWGFIRRQWGFTAAILVTTGLFGLLAIGLYGLHNVLDYAQVASYISRRGESYADNQTVNGLVNRLLFNGDNVLWRGDAFAPYHPVVYGVTLASTLLLLGLGVFFARKDVPSAVHLALAMLALTMASPIAWTHHYGVLFPIFAVVLPWVLARKPWGRWSVPAMFAGYVLVSQSFVYITRPLADTLLNPLQSYVLIGAALVLALMVTLIRRGRVLLVTKDARGGGATTAAALLSQRPM
ncbi:glycosyltransferase 87 family protein [Variovorax sp. OV329]|uniref:glycosyltransferase 87 family protein n=1 Tax=Variovorax sp. OV329 TaxID=1882825 RepID=UPI0008F3F230|nr:glycosyltransferase 87 family protein [Variovorax sp. OV329]SFL87705.1 Protein of unknown function [Variovorax sp. OV329]